jgi:hypothetical protein
VEHCANPTIRAYPSPRAFVSGFPRRTDVDLARGGGAVLDAASTPAAAGLVTVLDLRRDEPGRIYRKLDVDSRVALTRLLLAPQTRGDDATEPRPRVSRNRNR